jgi:hypothetical protein
VYKVGASKKYGYDSVSNLSGVSGSESDGENFKERQENKKLNKMKN